MTVKGVGIDIVEIDRVRNALQKWGDIFENKILTGEEISSKEKSSKGRVTFLAGRFAAKEAIFKSLGVSIPYWQKLSILAGERGEPVVKFRKEILKESKVKNVKRILVSISHSKKYAVAQALVLG